MEAHRSIIYGGVWNSTYQDPQCGGPTCAAQTTYAFKMSLNLLLAPYMIFVLIGGFRLLFSRLEKPESSSPSSFEYLISLLSFLTFASQVYFKAANYSLVYMLNPCHVLLLVQSFLLFLKPGSISRILYAISLGMTFCPWIALAFLETEGLNIPWEFQMFFIQHFLAAIINPFILARSKRYSDPVFSSFFIWLLGFTLFTLFQRIILTGVSHLTWTNLNHSLCSTEGDPFIPYVGNYYYLAAEFYLGVPSFIVNSLFQCCAARSSFHSKTD